MKIQSKKPQITLLSLLFIFVMGNSQAGWFDKSLEKYKKAKDVLNSTTKLEKLKSKKEHKKPNHTAKKIPENTSKKIDSETNHAKKPVVSNKSNKNTKAVLLSDETITLKLSNNGRLKTLTLPAYKGIIINGGQSFRTPLSEIQHPRLSISQTKIKLARIKGERATDYQTYQRLFAIQQTSKSLDKSQLKRAFFKSPEYKNQQQYANLLSWKKVAGYLAVLALSDKSYRKYFCGENDCRTQAKLKLDRGNQSRYVSTGVKLHWGGIQNRNEFKTRKLITEFIDNEFSQLVQWSKKHRFNNIEYVYRETKLPPYNFQLGVFDIKIKLDPYQLAKGSLFNNKVRISNSEAETLAKQHNHKQIFYGFKVKKIISNQSYIYKSKMYDVNNIKFNYVITSSAIDLFWKANLTDKWLALPISKMGFKGKTNTLSSESKRKDCFQYFKKHGSMIARRCAGLCNKQKLAGASANNINRCNNAYNEFKSMQNKPLGSNIRNKHLDEVIGILRPPGGELVLSTTNKAFKECAGYRSFFKMATKEGTEKAMNIWKVNKHAKVKLIDVNWKINTSGNRTSRCVATDIVLVK